MAQDTLAGQEMGVEVRPARPEDRAAVLAFCEHTWQHGDYIADVWDDWLRDARGVLLVGLLAGRPVALTHVRMLSDDEAWLEGMRVDPAARRQGIARVMTSRALVAARERGAAVARLFTSHTNIASQRLCAAFGMTRVAEVVRYEADATGLADELAPALRRADAGAAGAAGEPSLTEVARGGEIISPDTRLVIPDEAAFERIWDWLVQSNLTPFTGGLEFDGWAARVLSEPHLRAYLASGDVLLLEEWDTIQALAVVHARPADGDEPPHLAVRLVDGMADGIGRMALILREEAAARGLARVALWLPDLLILENAMQGAGYQRDSDGAMWVYARAL